MRTMAPAPARTTRIVLAAAAAIGARIAAQEVRRRCATLRMSATRWCTSIGRASSRRLKRARASTLPRLRPVRFAPKANGPPLSRGSVEVGRVRPPCNLTHAGRHPSPPYVIDQRPERRLLLAGRSDARTWRSVERRAHARDSGAARARVLPAMGAGVGVRVALRHGMYGDRAHGASTPLPAPSRHRRPPPTPPQRSPQLTLRHRPAQIRERPAWPQQSQLGAGVYVAHQEPARAQLAQQRS